jgi:hypothetical protein
LAFYFILINDLEQINVDETADFGFWDNVVFEKIVQVQILQIDVFNVEGIFVLVCV